MSTYTPSMIANISAQSAAFRFVAMLAGEVSKGQVDLPAFPEVVARIKNALSDDSVTPVKVAQLVASEAGLAARLMTMANSVIMNPSGTQITELKTAIVRIGYNNVRTTAVAYAVTKLRQAKELEAIRGELEMLWTEATTVAALSWAIARRVPHINADEAMLAGLVHNIGKLYILSRSQGAAHGQFAVSDMGTLVRDWHANVGKAIVENWGFSHAIVAAVGEHEDQDRIVRQADMGDVLQVAVRLVPYMSETDAALPAGMLGANAFLRLAMDETRIPQVIREGAGALETLRNALGV